jgi:hypothetical protein
MVTLARRAQRIPFAPVVAVLFGIAAAILVAAVPQWLFESGVVASGLPSVLAAAAPPLGLLARLLAIALAFAGVGFLFWAFLTPVTRLFEAKARARTPWRDGGYDGSYDADAGALRDDPLPPRRPIFAPEELGAPLMSDEAIAPLVTVAEPEVVLPIEAELAAPLAAEELTPVVPAPDNSDNSITALIRRLEDGLARRAADDANPDGPGNGAMPLSRSWIVPENVEGAPSSGDAADDDSTLRQALGTLRRMARS